MPTELPALHPGDVLLFTDLTLHRSGPNVAKTARWSADWAYELSDEDPITPTLEPQVVMGQGTARGARGTPPSTGADIGNNDVGNGMRANAVADENGFIMSFNTIHGGGAKLAIAVALGTGLLFAFGGVARLMRVGRTVGRS